MSTVYLNAHFTIPRFPYNTPFPDRSDRERIDDKIIEAFYSEVYLQIPSKSARLENEALLC